jgi:catechol 2,3-dioxygenase-like lactoylglutathione lyase family enzyme
MKRLHVHVSVDDLAQSTRFYSTLFAAEPTADRWDQFRRSLATRSAIRTGALDYR